ncbi:hypothetical protein [Asticcacaulis excentricus]|uniref:Uncharacterized protein n=1 Tax=Asticcacaulis excentricus TaxID=78587 RepID=A0A3G9GA04_9CAUL|nr:hypothetical protein [Asticcacaulis excentricus]BBF81238.1 hypothetical protein EM6_1835 [Asticcacaulis excentricus]
MTETLELYGLLSDLVEAALNGLNLWPALLAGVIAALLIWLPVAARLLVALCLTLVFSSLWPLLYSLPPLAPDFGEPEYSIQFALMALVAIGPVWLTEALGIRRLTQRKPRTSCIS